jgi:DNA-binding XRE family transcriptional regulator
LKTPVTNQLAPIRKRRGIGPSDLARKVGVSRQTIHAIETGEYVPNTEVALRLAQELEVTVDDLFSLPREFEKPPESLTVEYVSDARRQNASPCDFARWARVGWAFRLAPRRIISRKRTGSLPGPDARRGVRIW